MLLQRFQLKYSFASEEKKIIEFYILLTYECTHVVKLNAFSRNINQFHGIDEKTKIHDSKSCEILYLKEVLKFIFGKSSVVRVIPKCKTKQKKTSVHILILEFRLSGKNSTAKITKTDEKENNVHLHNTFHA